MGRGFGFLAFRMISGLEFKRFGLRARGIDDIQHTGGRLALCACRVLGCR